MLLDEIEEFNRNFDDKVHGKEFKRKLKKDKEYAEQQMDEFAEELKLEEERKLDDIPTPLDFSKRRYTLKQFKLENLDEYDENLLKKAESMTKNAYKIKRQGKHWLNGWFYVPQTQVYYRAGLSYHANGLIYGTVLQ